MKKVLVTGGAGYIGSHTCKALAKAGYTPISIDNLSQGHHAAVRWGPLIEGDVTDAGLLNRVMAQHHPEAVIHQAFLPGAVDSVRNPDLYYQNNVFGAYTVLEAMRRHAIRHLIFASSCAVYGDPVDHRISESHQQSPTNPFGRTAKIVEQMLKDYCGAYGVHSVSLRLFNVAGADPDGELGEDHNPETHIVPLLLDAAVGPNPGFVINGASHETPDGTCVRDYVHIADIARGHVLALEALHGGRGSHVYNLGSGKGTSVKDMVAIAERVTGKEIKTEMGMPRSSEPAILVADPTRAHNRLRWKPQVTDVEQMIASAWKWKQSKGAKDRAFSQKKPNPFL